MDRLQLLRRLARPSDTKIVLLVLDGVGDIHTEAAPRTPLEAASTPHLDALARRGASGRIQPASVGITPGSGPGHLALFGYDPLQDANDVGRGVLEALGLGLEIGCHTVAARANFATVDETGKLLDRRAGRIPTEECRRLVRHLRSVLETIDTGPLRLRIHAGEGYRFVLLIDERIETNGGTTEEGGAGLSAQIADTDPQALGRKPLPLRALTEEASATVEALQPVVEQLQEALAGEPQANSFLLRGFSQRPRFPAIPELYQMKAGAFAGYPLYRGVAGACGMEVFDCGKTFTETVHAALEHASSLDYLFLHVKATDMAGEDGDFGAKVEALESVDRELPRLIEALPGAVYAVTGDHSTPAPMRSHSWHPVPLLVVGANSDVDQVTSYDESSALRGALGTFDAHQLMGLLLANAGRLHKFGA